MASGATGVRCAGDYSLWRLRLQFVRDFLTSKSIGSLTL